MVKLTITDMNDNILEEEAYRSHLISPERVLAKRIIEAIDTNHLIEVIEAPEDEDDDS